MLPLDNKEVLVLGLGISGVAASQLLARCGARVWAVDSANTELLRVQAEQLQAIGIEVQLGATTAPSRRFDLVVVSPGVPPANPIFAAMKTGGVPMIGELELGAQNSLC